MNNIPRTVAVFDGPQSDREVNALALAAQLERELAAKSAEVERLRAALQRIEKWFGEFPPTCMYWDEPHNTREMSYAGAFGSNGERDYMRGIARAALEEK